MPAILGCGLTFILIALPVEMSMDGRGVIAKRYDDDISSRQVQLVDLEREQHLPLSTASRLNRTLSADADHLSAAGHRYRLSYSYNDLQPHSVIDQNSQDAEVVQIGNAMQSYHMTNAFLPKTVQEAIYERQQQNQRPQYELHMQQHEDFGQLSAGYERPHGHSSSYVLAPSYQTATHRIIASDTQPQVPTVPATLLYESEPQEMAYLAPTVPAPHATLATHTNIPLNDHHHHHAYSNIEDKQKPSKEIDLPAQQQLHYLTENHLTSYETLDSDTGLKGLGAVNPTALSPIVIRRPAIVYGPPQSPQSQQSSTSEHIMPPGLHQAYQSASKQFTYAPARSEGRSLPSYASKIPFPPSFISITTTTAYPPSQKQHQHQHQQQQYYHRSFNYAPLPDLFSHRQSKSLLDSYIPSWVIEMIAHQQQQQQQQRLHRGFNLNTIATFRPLGNGAH